MAGRSRKRILLIGAGHGHLNVIRDSRSWPDEIELSVVAPGDFWYSGLATGMLGGQYDVPRDRVDVAALCRGVGATFIGGALASLDATAKTATLDDGRVLEYDVASLNLGSVVNVPPSLDLTGDRAFRVKPISDLARLRRLLENNPSVRRIAVVGAGYGGSECALNLAALGRRLGRGLCVTLLAGEHGPGRHLPSRARATLRRALDRAGVRVLDARGDDADLGPPIVVRHGTGEVEADAVLYATGLRPPPLVSALGLATDDQGHLLVDACLRCVGHAHLFAVGDATNPADARPFPKIGVIAVFQGRRLRHNLVTAATGGRLRRYRPGRRHLLILNLGDGAGLAVYGRLHWSGRSALWLKRLIDERWLRSFQPFPAESENRIVRRGGHR